MSPSAENPPALSKDAVVLLANISQLMDEAEGMLGESPNASGEATVGRFSERFDTAESRLAARYAAVKAQLAAAGRRHGPRVAEALLQLVPLELQLL
jgi:hypothetical protein